MAQRARRARGLIALAIAAAAVGVIGASVAGWMPGSPSPTSVPSIGSQGPTPQPAPTASAGEPRGYLTTPGELEAIAERARAGEEPFATAVDDVIDEADRPWEYQLDVEQSCPSADEPAWLDDSEGASRVYARALAYHLTGETRYAAEVSNILERVMASVETIDLEVQRCSLVFAWGTPEFVAAADLIEGYWLDETCSGPTSTIFGEGDIGQGDCKDLFGNWLVKNPYYVLSYVAINSKSNWGAAATNALAYVADYLWDRPEVRLVHRQPPGPNGDGIEDVPLSPAAAYAFAKELALNRMNGYGVEFGSSSSCDYLAGDQQNPQWAPVKSQITEDGIIPEDARREEFCNVPRYNGEYQNYPQIHLGNLIQQCELMLRRGDRSCYDNVDRTDLPDYTFVGPDGDEHTTHLHPGRGSLERAINAVIVDSATEWRRASALAVAYRYYREHHALEGVETWVEHLEIGAGCAQDLCFGTLTHGLAEGDPAPPPPMVAPPRDG